MPIDLDILGLVKPPPLSIMVALELCCAAFVRVRDKLATIVRTWRIPVILVDVTSIKRVCVRQCMHDAGDKSPGTAETTFAECLFREDVHEAQDLLFVIEELEEPSGDATHMHDAVMKPTAGPPYPRHPLRIAISDSET